MFAPCAQPIAELTVWLCRIHDCIARPVPTARCGRWPIEAIPDDGNRYEILHGELLVTPLPSTGHQRIAMRLSILTVLWCRAHTGWTVLAPSGVHVSDTTWLEPDLAAYAAPESDNLSWREMPPPLLVVEVLSPSTRRRDRHRKRPTYLSHGVGELWLVDPDTRTIERWTSASEFPETLRDGPIGAAYPQRSPVIHQCHATTRTPFQNATRSVTSSAPWLGVG